MLITKEKTVVGAMTKKELIRCSWAGDDPLYIMYHDEEWGVPVHEERKHYEFLILEGAQAGLSWITILKRREEYRKAFANFNFQKVAKFTEEDQEMLKTNSGIIRNRLKIRSAINNARRFIKVQEELGSFDKYIWGFTNGKSIQNTFKTLSEIPTQTDISIKMSKDMKKRGFTFVGPTICYAHMQAIGMVNDHLINCFRYKEIQELY